MYCICEDLWKFDVYKKALWDRKPQIHKSQIRKITKKDLVGRTANLTNFLSPPMRSSDLRNSLTEPI
jgi:hypothetical protein